MAARARLRLGRRGADEGERAGNARHGRAGRGGSPLTVPEVEARVEERPPRLDRGARPNRPASTSAWLSWRSTAGRSPIVPPAGGGGEGGKVGSSGKAESPATTRPPPTERICRGFMPPLSRRVELPARFASARKIGPARKLDGVSTGMEIQAPHHFQNHRADPRTRRASRSFAAKVGSSSARISDRILTELDGSKLQASAIGPR